MRVNVELSDAVHLILRRARIEQRKTLAEVISAAVEHYAHAERLAGAAEDERVARVDQDERR